MARIGGESGLLEKGRALLLAPLEQAMAPFGQDLGLAGGAKGATNAQLRAALERFITDRYLPDVYVHFRWVSQQMTHCSVDDSLDDSLRTVMSHQMTHSSFVYLIRSCDLWVFDESLDDS